VDRKLSLEKFRMLKLIDELSRKSEFGFAKVGDLIKVVCSQKKIRESSVRKMVWELAKDGYIESPIRGCWRLTEKARAVLKGVEGA
jgi:Mn-dependent DtxR family transcriptional regulator